MESPLPAPGSAQVDNVLYWIGDLKAGSKPTLLYNKAADEGMLQCHSVKVQPPPPEET